MRTSIWSFLLFFVLLAVLGVSGCAPASTPLPPTPTPSSIALTFTAEPTATETPPPSPTAIPESTLRQVNEDGYGDPNNGNTLALEVFNGFLYAGVLNSEKDVVVKRFDGNSWEDVSPEGFADSQLGLETFVVYGEYLYGGTGAAEGNHAEIWRSKDGINWEKVLGDELANYHSEISRLFIYKNKLYASTWSYSLENGLEVWSSETGNPGTWETVVKNGFDAKNSAILGSATFRNRLFVATLSPGCPKCFDEPNPASAQVFVTDNGTDWLPVSNNSPIEHLGYISALAVYNDYLYAAGSISAAESVSKYGQQNEEAHVYRCTICDGSDWELVFDGPYKNPDTGAKQALEVYQGILYLVVGNRKHGAEIFRSADGITWENIASEGIDDKNNAKTYWDNDMVIFNEELYVGFDNFETGTEVWKISH